MKKPVIRGGFGVAYNRIADTISAITRVDPPFLFREGACCAMSTADQAANPWGQKPFFPTPAGNLIVVSEGQTNRPLGWAANPPIAAALAAHTGPTPLRAVGNCGAVPGVSAPHSC